MEDLHLAGIVVSTIRNAPVLMFAALAGLFAERSGVVDIGLEGKILGSAFASVALAMVQAFVSITQKGNQLVCGIAINIAMSGLTFVLAQFFFQQGGRTPDLGDARFTEIVFPGTAALDKIPFIGWLYGHV